MSLGCSKRDFEVMCGKFVLEYTFFFYKKVNHASSTGLS